MRHLPREECRKKSPDMKDHRILFIGLGSLGAKIFDECVRVPGHHHFLVGGRNIEALQKRINLSMLAAIQLGYTPKTDCTHLDLYNIEQTASVIARFQPDLIFCAATLQQLSDVQHFSPLLAQQLAVAPMGPRLPRHLTLDIWQAWSARRKSSMRCSPMSSIPFWQKLDSRQRPVWVISPIISQPCACPLPVNWISQ